MSTEFEKSLIPGTADVGGRVAERIDPQRYC